MDQSHCGTKINYVGNKNITNIVCVNDVIIFAKSLKGSVDGSRSIAQRGEAIGTLDLVG